MVVNHSCTNASVGARSCSSNSSSGFAFRQFVCHACGLAVVFTTSEVSECLSIPHRVLVMSKGRISAEFKPGVTKDEIMAASGESVAA